MIKIYEKYGYYKETQCAITLKGIEGAEKIKEIMNNLRNNQVQNIGNFKVVELRDYKQKTTINMETGEKGTTELPESNVLYYALENDAWCCVRPSGTEPKIKFYIGVKGNSIEDAKQQAENLKAEVLKLTQ